jgi:septum formation protein
MRLILASGSPRRADLLRAAGYAFETIVTDVDEQLRPGETPPQYVRRLAAEKSSAALALVMGPAKAGRHGNEPAEHVASGFSRTDELIVLGADTAVIVDGAVLGKPRDNDEATAMLRRLSGRAHEVLTGISLRNSASEVGRVEATSVGFAPLSDDEVAAYVSSGEGRDKAGGYAIQGLASRFTSVIQGSYSNVVGLPMEALAELLPEFRR